MVPMKARFITKTFLYEPVEIQISKGAYGAVI